MPQNISVVVFCNKGMKRINLNGILKFEDSIAYLLEEIQLQEHTPVATYRLTPKKKKGNKSSNYKESVQAIIVDDKISFSSARTYNCEISEFRDEHMVVS